MESPELDALAALLDRAYGSDAEATAAFERALTYAGRREVPPRLSQLVAFVRGHLIRVLSEDLGPRRTMALLDEWLPSVGLAPALHPARSIPAPVRPVPSIRPRRSVPLHMAVLLVDPDRIGRTTLARTLVRGDCDVVVIDSAAELRERLVAGDPLDAAIVDTRHSEAREVIELLVEALPRVVIVARAVEIASTRTMLRVMGVLCSDVRSGDATGEELLRAAREARKLLPNGQ